MSADSSRVAVRSSSLRRITFHPPAEANGGGGVELRGFARGENQKGTAELALHEIVGGEDGFFFSGDDAAGYQDWPAFLLADLLLEPVAEAGDCGRGGVVF